MSIVICFRWRAFIFYAYCEELSFYPLKSQQMPRPKEQDLSKAPLCSPKSMYRIAHKVLLAIPMDLLVEAKLRIVRYCVPESEGNGRYQVKAFSKQYPRRDIFNVHISVRGFLCFDCACQVLPDELYQVS